MEGKQLVDCGGYYLVQVSLCLPVGTKTIDYNTQYGVPCGFNGQVRVDKFYAQTPQDAEVLVLRSLREQGKFATTMVLTEFDSQGNEIPIVPVDGPEPDDNWMEELAPPSLEVCPVADCKLRDICLPCYAEPCTKRLSR